MNIPKNFKGKGYVVFCERRHDNHIQYRPVFAETPDEARRIRENAHNNALNFLVQGVNPLFRSTLRHYISRRNPQNTRDLDALIVEMLEKETMNVVAYKNAATGRYEAAYCTAGRIRTAPADARVKRDAGARTYLDLRQELRVAQGKDDEYIRKLISKFGLKAFKRETRRMQK